MANIAHTYEILSDCPTEITPMLWGAQGCGKTEIIRELSEEVWNLTPIELQGGQLADVADLLGLQQIIEIVGKDGKIYKETTWLPPYWLPKDNKPICLFLDELNRASPAILKAMMQIANDHKLLNFELPKGSRVVCACNPKDGNGDFDVEEFDDAQKDRFWHLPFDPDVDEWLNWGKTKGNILPIIIDYIDQNQSDLDLYSFAKAAGTGQASNFPAMPSRRSWKRFSDWLRKLINKNEKYLKTSAGKALIENIATGFFGPEIATRFVTFFSQHDIGITPRSIMEATEADWRELVKTIKTWELTDCTKFGISLCNFLYEMQDNLVHDPETINMLMEKLGDKFKKQDKINPLGKQYANNFYKYITLIPIEAAAQLCANTIDKARDRNERWVGVISLGSNELMDFLCEMSNYHQGKI